MLGLCLYILWRTRFLCMHNETDWWLNLFFADHSNYTICYDDSINIETYIDSEIYTIVYGGMYIVVICFILLAAYHVASKLRLEYESQIAMEKIEELLGQVHIWIIGYEKACNTNISNFNKSKGSSLKNQSNYDHLIYWRNFWANSRNYNNTSTRS